MQWQQSCIFYRPAISLYSKQLKGAHSEQWLLLLSELSTEEAQGLERLSKHGLALDKHISVSN